MEFFFRDHAHKILIQDIDSLLQKGAIEPLPSQHQEKGFYSKCFLIPKKKAGWRLIFDLRQVSVFIRRLKFPSPEEVDCRRCSLRWDTHLDKCSKRNMDCSRGQVERKPPGIESWPRGLQTILTALTIPTSSGGARQHDNSVLHQQAKGSEIFPSVDRGGQPVEVVYSSPDHSISSTPPGNTQYISRQPQQPRLD